MSHFKDPYLNDLFSQMWQPAYYKEGRADLITALEKESCNLAFGFCYGNIKKYLKRAGKKEGNPAIQDKMKAYVYSLRAAELQAKHQIFQHIELPEITFNLFDRG